MIEPGHMKTCHKISGLWSFMVGKNENLGRYMWGNLEGNFGN